MRVYKSRNKQIKFESDILGSHLLRNNKNVKMRLDFSLSGEERNTRQTTLEEFFSMSRGV